MKFKNLPYSVFHLITALLDYKDILKLQIVCSNFNYNVKIKYPQYAVCLSSSINSKCLFEDEAIDKGHLGCVMNLSTDKQETFLKCHQKGHLHIFKFLFKIGFYKTKKCSLICCPNDANQLAEFCPIHNQKSFIERCETIFARNNNLEGLKLCHEFELGITTDSLIEILKNDDVECFKFWYKIHPRPQHILRNVIKYNSKKCFKHLIETFLFDNINYFICIIYDNLEFLKHFIKLGSEWNQDDLEFAKENNKIKCYEYMMNNK